MGSIALSHLALLAQQNGGAAYEIGRIVGMIFMVVLLGAILW